MLTCEILSAREAKTVSSRVSRLKANLSSFRKETIKNNVKSELNDYSKVSGGKLVQVFRTLECETTLSESEAGTWGLNSLQLILALSLAS